MIVLLLHHLLRCRHWHLPLKVVSSGWAVAAPFGASLRCCAAELCKVGDLLVMIALFCVKARAQIPPAELVPTLTAVDLSVASRDTNFRIILLHVSNVRHALVSSVRAES